MLYIAITASAQQKVVLVIHGGAGTITRASMTPELEQQYRQKLSEALTAGYAVLDGGGSSLDAISTAIQILEDSPLFNAGRGAVFTHAGKNELDASIMDGKTGQAGVVAGVTTIKSPMLTAQAVMQQSPHEISESQPAKSCQGCDHEKMKEIGGEGGIIAVDGKGNITMPFNSAGMYRGYMNEKGKARVFIYQEEK